MKNLYLTVGRAQVFRCESYNGNTTARVEWEVVYTRDDGKQVVVRCCSTRKDALKFAEIYSF